MIDDLCEAIAVHMASYQKRTINLYNKRVTLCAFQVGDLVLRRVFENTADLVTNKFQPNWEGSYMTVKVGLARSYALDKLDGTLVPKMWNATHLKRYYQ